jgi:hypothetical protein
MINPTAKAASAPTHTALQIGQGRQFSCSAMAILLGVSILHRPCRRVDLRCDFAYFHSHGS